MNTPIATMIAAALLATSCQKANNNFASNIRFLNATTDVPAYTLKVNGQTLLTNAAYNQLFPLASTPSGTIAIAFFKNNNPSPDTSFTTNLAAGNNYTCLLYDSATHPALFFKPEIVPQTISPGKCAIRFFPLIPKATALYLTNDTGRIFLGERSYADFATTQNFVEADTTSLQLKLVKSGVAAPLATIRYPLVAGKIYTVFVTGSLGAAGTAAPKLIFLQHN